MFSDGSPCGKSLVFRCYDFLTTRVQTQNPRNVINRAPINAEKIEIPKINPLANMILKLKMRLNTALTIVIVLIDAANIELGVGSSNTAVELVLTIIP